MKKYALSYHPDVVVLLLMRNDIYAGRSMYTFRQLWLQANSRLVQLRRLLEHSYVYNALSSSVVFAREHLREKWYDPGVWRDANPPGDFAANLRDMIRDTERAGGKILVISEFWGDRIPTQLQNERIKQFRDVMEKAAREMDVPYYDAYDHFSQAPNPWVWVFPNDITHLNYEGHAEMAKYLEELMAQNKMLPVGR